MLAARAGRAAHASGGAAQDARMTALVETIGLTKHFALGRAGTVHAVDDVSLAIAEREVVGLVGESGSGKSTLGRTLVGLHAKTSGEVRFAGERLPDRYRSADFRRHAGSMQMIFQDPYSSLNPRMTVGEIIGEGLRLAGTHAHAQIRTAVADWLTRVGLDQTHASRYPHEFSGGQRQRVGIARALIVRPRFVVCDEPISALDVSVQAQIVRLLDELKAELGLTLLFIAHDLSMVRYVSDRMAVMYLGSLVEIGPADDVYFRPLHPYTQILVASNPEPNPRTERRRAAPVVTGDSPSPVNVGAGCRFASRCPKVMDVCRRVTPPLVPPATDVTRRVACHLYSSPPPVSVST
jgi:oligopeptide/dipeptide ABC transporter ATP-binding protein